jgi:hypothetical protein
MMLSNVSKQVIDIPTYIGTRGLNSSNDLWDNLEPGVDLNGSETRGHCMANIIVCAIFEPECQ